MSKIKISSPKIGTDPEFFLVREDKIISAIGLVGGSKEAPLDIGEGYALQEDNVLVELNIPPTTSKIDFKSRILIGGTMLQQHIPHGCSIKVQTSHMFAPNELNHPAAHVFGCDPDYNVYTRSKNESPVAPGAKTFLRTAGGHIHVGYDNPEVAINEQLVKAMDLFLGLPSVLMDTDALRRSMYGRAGSYRNKEYGVEYRTLSSFWLAKESYIEWVYDQTMEAIEFVNSGKTIPNSTEERIAHAINFNKYDIAFELCADHNIRVI